MSVNEYIDRATVDAKNAAAEEKERAAAAVEAEKIAKRKAKENAKEKAKKPASTGSTSLTKILNGDFLTKEFFLNNLTFIFFLFLLLLLVLGKGYYGKELYQNITKTQKELDEATSDYVEAKAQLEEETRRGKLREKLEGKGLKETVNETKVIRIKKGK
ncbi:MAG: FtsL-like putative cell division protein [Bacteroidota bacterium]